LVIPLQRAIFTIYIPMCAHVEAYDIPSYLGSFNGNYNILLIITNV
jgi:hypothetical protein